MSDSGGVVIRQSPERLRGCVEVGLASLVNGSIAYAEPVRVPLYAPVLLGQRPSAWAIAGGALIVAAGILVALYGQGAPELEPLG